MGAVVNALLRNWPWLVVTLAVAVSVHVVAVRVLPYAVMHVVLEKVGPMDTIRHGKRPDETSRAVVRPSPDLLYSTCPYDLALGPLRVTAPVPQSTYWSVSGFDAETNNFFVKNDSQAGAKVDFVLIAGSADRARCPKGFRWWCRRRGGG